MFRSKNIVIIGATGGIGSALVAGLASKGAKMFLVARSQENLLQLAIKFNCNCLSGDISVHESAKEIFSKASESLGAINGIVNLAGSVLLKPAHLTSAAEWDFTISQNLTTAFNCIRYGVQSMASSGSVVLLSSAAGRIGLANHEAISAAKAGVAGLTLSAAATYAAKGIRFNCIAPGLVKTTLTEKITSNPASEKASLSLHPLKRLGEVEDIVPLIEFLLSDSSSWITGQTIGADGGLSTLKTLQI